MSGPPKNSTKIMSRTVWDCESSLYDSFELKSFNRHLDAAIASRTLSMPHLRDPAIPKPIQKRSRKFSRSVNKLLRSLFRMKPHGDCRVVQEQPPEGIYVFCDDSGALSTIPEAPETLAELLLSPELKSVARRAVSDRFTSKTTPAVGISCAC